MADPTDDGSQMTAPDIAVAVDFDPGVWMVGPTDGDAEGWTEGALAAVCADFVIADGSAAQTAVREVLLAFATAELGSDFRFLRLRSLADVPVIALLHIWPVDPTDVDAARRGAAVLSEFEPGTRWYDHGPQLLDLDEETGLKRALRYALGDDGRLSSVIRYHRRVARPAADVVLTCAGADLRTTAMALGDLDDLARAVQLIEPRGTRP
ncbi:hypothetical protein DQ244_08980 [Blastococcus sp. TBT05-19]|uniref:hypothetical protein n=1 Tax=Blastococcus sp. TBT05-19 TaxID=2250581 RepID=UPI000DE8F7FB|nr:hypothetical protein [Blastococcus sp. TBT05-19]RBY91458.1 hypothetical protein DQ244_08980 [Blastococcus sp. TBT05-19]